MSISPSVQNASGRSVFFVTRDKYSTHFIQLITQTLVMGKLAFVSTILKLNSSNPKNMRYIINMDYEIII